MNLPEFEYRNNDPTDNIQVEFTDTNGNPRVLSFVATRPHWCEATDIHGELFAVPLEKVFDGDAEPVPPGSSQEEQLIQSFREHLEEKIENIAFFRKMALGEAHVSFRTHDQIRSLRLVWFLWALERRHERHRPRNSEHQA